MQRQHDRRQRRLIIARQLPVIIACHRDVRPHLKLPLLQPVIDAARHQIVHTEDRRYAPVKQPVRIAVSAASVPIPGTDQGRVIEDPALIQRPLISHKPLLRMGAVTLAGYHADPPMPPVNDVLHDLKRAVLIIHYNRRYLVTLRIAVRHHRRDRKILRYTPDRPLMGRHIDDPLHLLGDQFPDLIPHHTVEIIPMVIGIVVLLE